MIPQSFEAPRQETDLGGSVAAGALLVGHGLAALASARPARLALSSVDGPAATIIDLPVEPIRDIALLSKDTAVVLGESGTLWGVVDLHGAVKVRPVASGVRALCGRPTGESALAIAEENKAIALSLSRQEIGVRTFSVRGALHACDVGEQVTYAVTETAAGRQLHVHPGATPELGTSVRATLPEGAAGLDRVRGSQSLCAVFKQGEPQVCVVTGAPKLVAKLVRLDARPSDVAVLDGWVIAVTLDGRLVLYSPEALSSAGEEALAATTSISLAAQGRPRVLLAASHKGTPHLWIGTTAGEVLHASGALRSAESIHPVPSAPKPTVPVLTALLVARDQEIELLRAEAEQRNVAHASELETLLEQADERARSLHADLDARTGERDRARAEIEAARSTLVAAEEQIQSLAAELEDRTNAYDALRTEVDRLVGDLAKERDRIAKTFPFGSYGLKSIERARDRVEGVLAQIHGIVFKRPGE